MEPITPEQQQQLDALDFFHGQTKAIILHSSGPRGAQMTGFNLANFAANAWKIFSLVWPVLQPVITGAIGLDPTTMKPIAVTTDPALPTKAT